MTVSKAPLVQGVLLSFLAYTLFVMCDAMAKTAGLGGYSTLFIVIASSWSATFTAFILLGVQGKLHRLRPVFWKKHLIRAVLFLAGFFANVTCFTNLPLPIVYVTMFMGPLFITLIGALFMGEHINRKQILAVVLGFLGVLIALLPSHDIAIIEGENRTLGFIVLPCFLALFVANMLYLRVMGRTETPEGTAFNPFILRAVLLLPALYYVMPSSFPLVPLLCSFGLGTVSCLAFVCLSKAYKIAPVAIVSPLQYTQLITGSLSGYLIWEVAPTKWTFAGGFFIILSGLLVAREAHLQQKEMVEKQLVVQAVLSQQQP